MVVQRISLHIGEIFVSKEPCIVDTILGSCVSVCIFSQTEGVGGLIHYALPSRRFAEAGARNDLHFGDSAIRLLVQQVRGLLKSPQAPLQAKVVGGGKVIDSIRHSEAIGDLNIQMALQILEELKIPVVGKSVGGNSGRKIYFYTSTGRLRVSNLRERETPAPPSLPQPSRTKKIRVFVVDDSKTIREILTRILTSADTEVIGTAANPIEAEPLILKLKPDVITLDISMPLMDGVSFVQKFLPRHFFPIVMISSISPQESDLVFRALEYGAVDYFQKPSYTEMVQQGAVIREKVLTASKIQKPLTPSFKNFGARAVPLQRPTGGHDKIFFLGASTGGTEALKEVLTRLPGDTPPILIVQHIPPVFSSAYAKRLNELCAFEVKEAEDGDEVRSGRALLAPGGKQMEIVRKANQYYVRVFEGEKTSGHRPSVDVLFKSAAQHVGAPAIGVILTGMGNDGALGLLKMRQKGARTLCQDEKSSIVYGMPKAAFEMGGCEEVHELSAIPKVMMSWIQEKKPA